MFTLLWLAFWIAVTIWETQIQMPYIIRLLIGLAGSILGLILDATIFGKRIR